ncbi:hypothetical protein F5Y18DRAFT_406394 [Xylariaceae sp. FL1019]|nr:hypothetical protein F5Y18DRAFT_406394 [Xylariaceae sp. FL1019]
MITRLDPLQILIYKRFIIPSKSASPRSSRAAIAATTSSRHLQLQSFTTSCSENIHATTIAALSVFRKSHEPSSCNSLPYPNATPSPTMSAPGITYGGVLAQGDTNLIERRKLFTGLTFWLSAYLGTHRSMCKGMIEENGGTVVKLEKQANVLLVDPAKQDPPPGSYSYKLIEDAIKEGSLDRKEVYLCKPPIDDHTVASPRAASKTTRNKFTAEEDTILTQFVIESERLGEAIGGNEIYKEFASKHPSHTWQSWQDRWRKKLKLLPRPAIFSDPTRPPQTEHTPQAASRAISDEHGSCIKKRARFTADEDSVLLDTIHQAILDQEPWKGNNVYKRLSKDFPQRSYQSWRERAISHVAIQHEDQIKQWESDCGATLGDEDDVRELPRHQHTQEPRDKSHTKSTATPSPRKKSSPRSSSAPNAPNSVSRQANRNETGDVYSSPNGSVDLTIQPGSERGQHSGSDTNRSSSSPAHSSELVTETTEKEQFINDYNIWLENNHRDPGPGPTIRGKDISLWELWRAVTSKKMVLAELDWQQVAEDMGFNWLESPSIPDEVRQCYESYLAEFAEAISGFDADTDDTDDVSSDEDSSEENSSEIRDNSSDRYSQVDIEEPMASSPPLRTSRKRSIDADLPIPEKTPRQILSKRRKTDPSGEIPSTPEYINGTANLRHLSDPDKRQYTPHQTFHTPGDGTQKEEDEETGDQLADLPNLPRIGNRTEPETQDFHFDPDTQANARGGTPMDVENDTQMTNTPSQQLQRESDDITSPERQIESPPSISLRRKTVQSTPTPGRKTKVPFLPDESDDDLLLGMDSGGKGDYSRRPHHLLAATLRASKSPQSPSSNPNPTSQSLSARKPSPKSKPKSPPVDDEPDEIKERFIMLGYPEDIVVRSLQATSWNAGDAGYVMEVLKRGEPLPRNTTGVWTQRDDDALKLVYSTAAPSSDKEERKRAKQLQRLQSKHGDEQIARRRWYLLE